MAEKKIAVVVGGANGIGAACCDVMHARGWTVVVADRDIAAGKETAKRVGGHAYQLDVLETAMIEDLAARVDRDVGAVDALVVSSGIFQANVPIEQTPPDVFDTIMAVNVRGTYFANKVFGQAMAERGGGEYRQSRLGDRPRLDAAECLWPRQGRDHHHDQEFRGRMGQARRAGEQRIAGRHAGAAYRRAQAEGGTVTRQISTIRWRWGVASNRPKSPKSSNSWPRIAPRR